MVVGGPAMEHFRESFSASAASSQSLPAATFDNCNACRPKAAFLNVALQWRVPTTSGRIDGVLGRHVGVRC